MLGEVSGRSPSALRAPAKSSAATLSSASSSRVSMWSGFCLRQRLEPLDALLRRLVRFDLGEGGGEVGVGRGAPGLLEDPRRVPALVAFRCRRGRPSPRRGRGRGRGGSPRSRPRAPRWTCDFVEHVLRLAQRQHGIAPLVDGAGQRAVLELGGQRLRARPSSRAVRPAGAAGRPASRHAAASARRPSRPASAPWPCRLRRSSAS